MVKMKPIDLKKWRADKKELEEDQDYRRRYFAMDQKDHELIELIHKKLEICRKLNDFLGENKEPMDSLTWMEIRQYDRIHNFLNERS
jgi:hypothetical protein